MILVDVDSSSQRKSKKQKIRQQSMRVYTTQPTTSRVEPNNYALLSASGFFSCFALSEQGQVIWFDELGLPVEVLLKEDLLVRGGLLALPAQPLEVITEVEAFEQLLMLKRRALTGQFSTQLGGLSALSSSSSAPPQALSFARPLLMNLGMSGFLPGPVRTTIASAANVVSNNNNLRHTNPDLLHRRMMNVLLAVLVVGAAWAGYGILSGDFAARSRSSSSSAQDTQTALLKKQSQAGDVSGFAGAGSGTGNAGRTTTPGSGSGVVGVVTIATSAKGSPDSYRPIGPPTISLNVFRDYLREMGSPALSEAEAMYQTAIEEGGDPAVALAFFEHESSGGRAGVAVQTHSIGNIRCTPGYACTGTQGNGSFRSYATWADGVRDWVRLLKSYKAGGWKAITLEQIIPHYAPQADHNNESAYIAGVKATVDKLRGRN